MTDTLEPKLWVGIDWAKDKNDVCVVDREGDVLGERKFPSSATGIAELIDWLLGIEEVGPQEVWIAIETPHGPLVETLLARKFVVHSINPKQLDRFRDRFTVSGAKDDRRDARVLAVSLRTDIKAFRLLRPDDPLVIELRGYSRSRGRMKAEQTALENQLREALGGYFRQPLELISDVSEPFFLDLLEIASTPGAAREVPLDRIAALLKKRRIRRLTAEQVRAKLLEPSYEVDPATVKAASFEVGMLVERLRLLGGLIKKVERQIGEVFRLIAEKEIDEADGPCDVQILLTMPGVGQVVLGTLLAEASRIIEDRDGDALRLLSGVAPVTRRSGKSIQVVMRKACNGRLRNAVYNWARVAAQRDEHWKEVYGVHRNRGQSHGCACRAVGDGLIRVAMAMLETRTTYDPSRWKARAQAA